MHYSSFYWIACDRWSSFFISVSQPVLHPLLLCSKCACLHHGSHPMCPLLMASVVIEFDAAHLQPNKRAVSKSPNSPIQYYWYFTGCIIKLNNPLWLEVKWWNSFQWPQLNHKQKAFLMFLHFSVSWLPERNNNCWTWNAKRRTMLHSGFLVNVFAYSSSSVQCFDYNEWPFITVTTETSYFSLHYIYLKAKVLIWCIKMT